MCLLQRRCLTTCGKTYQLQNVLFSFEIKMTMKLEHQGQFVFNMIYAQLLGLQVF